MAAGTPALSTKDSVVNNVSPWRRTRRLESWQTIQSGWPLALFLYLLLLLLLLRLLLLLPSPPPPPPPPLSPAHPTHHHSSPFLPVSASFSLFPEPVAHKLIRSRCPLARDSHWPPQSRRSLCFLCRLCPDRPRHPRPPTVFRPPSIHRQVAEYFAKVTRAIAGASHGLSTNANRVDDARSGREGGSQLTTSDFSSPPAPPFPRPVRVTSHSYTPVNVVPICCAFEFPPGFRAFQLLKRFLLPNRERASYPFFLQSSRGRIVIFIGRDPEVRYGFQRRCV